VTKVKSATGGRFGSVTVTTREVAALRPRVSVTKRVTVKVPLAA
jgi:hypothetical protein